MVGPGIDLPCALGRSGPGHDKREGDGLTPIGRFRVIGAFYRPDRMRRPATSIRLRAIRPDLGWADDPQDRRYNRPIPLPSPCGHERMWREDALYDLVLDLSYNRGPIVRGRGSAIFLHSARPGFLPTEGCVAVERARIRALVERIGPDTVIEIVG
jgi:L,D-peptidoglycan transpeptidase YkuD (ErfK/YbiS/YcfS/YnhG family)